MGTASYLEAHAEHVGDWHFAERQRQRCCIFVIQPPPGRIQKEYEAHFPADSFPPTLGGLGSHPLWVTKELHRVALLAPYLATPARLSDICQETHVMVEHVGTVGIEFDAQDAWKSLGKRQHVTSYARCEVDDGASRGTLHAADERQNFFSDFIGSLLVGDREGRRVVHSDLRPKFRRRLAEEMVDAAARC